MSGIFCSSKLSQRIESIQKRAPRFLWNDYDSDYNELFLRSNQLLYMNIHIKKYYNIPRNQMHIMATLTEKEALHRSRATCLENVKNLNCWGSDLIDISIVRKMVNLQVLNLSANNISTLKDVAHCPRLKELYLRRNQLKSIDEIKYLKNLRHLNVLWLADNPCSSNSNYREVIIKNLANLKKLDSHEVSQEERNVVNTKNIIKFDDDDLPKFDNLNLDKTLTLNEVKELTVQTSNSKFSRSSSGSSNGQISMFSKPATQSYEEQRIFSDELPSSGMNASKQPKKEFVTQPSIPSKNLYHTGIVTNSRNKNSNTFSAIMLLTNDLDLLELKDLSRHVNNLIGQQSEVLLPCKEEQKDAKLLLS